MESTEFKKVDLESIGDGVAKELFDRELKNVMRNIDDRNTRAKTKRTIKMEVTFTPDETREACAVAVKCQSSLAPVTPHESTIFVIQEGNESKAYQRTANQPSLFETNVTKIANERKGK